MKRRIRAASVSTFEFRFEFRQLIRKKIPRRGTLRPAAELGAGTLEESDAESDGDDDDAAETWESDAEDDMDEDVPQNYDRDNPCANDSLARTYNVDEWDLEYDAKNGFPETPAHKALGWHEFPVDIYSSEADATEVIADVIEDCHEEWIDLRPYMIESPIAVSVHDKFYKVLEQFRINHCRHLMVLDPANGALRGVITRKDIFAYNHL